MNVHHSAFPCVSHVHEKTTHIHKRGMTHRKSIWNCKKAYSLSRGSVKDIPVDATFISKFWKKKKHPHSQKCVWIDYNVFYRGTSKFKLLRKVDCPYHNFSQQGFQQDYLPVCGRGNTWWLMILGKKLEFNILVSSQVQLLKICFCICKSCF